MATKDTIIANLTAAGFDNTSAVALYGQISQAVGVPIDNTITELNNAATVITNLITAKNYGKKGYYESKALAFQLGDNLIVNPVTFDSEYAVIDPTKQIISQAAFEDDGEQLFLKIATTNALTGDLMPLSPTQLAAFSAYFLTFELPGLSLSKISLPANIIDFATKCTYYATYDLPTLQTNIASALTKFRQSFTFDGEFFAGDMQDYIKQNVPGIRDFYIYNSTADGSPFGGNQTLASGYFNYGVNTIANITYAAV